MYLPSMKRNDVKVHAKEGLELYKGFLGNASKLHTKQLLMKMV